MKGRHQHMSEMKRAGIVGCGLMGSGIAEVCARNGLDVLVVESDPAHLEAGRARVAHSLDRAEARGKLPAADAEAAQQRIDFTTRLEDFADRDLVIERSSRMRASRSTCSGRWTRSSRRRTPSWPPTRPRCRW